MAGETAGAASTLGRVYVFNATMNSMALLLNSHILSASIAGVTQANSYQPSPLQVSRNPSSGNPGEATFGGKNVLIVSFPDGTAQQYDISINANQVQITWDLQLYIFFNEVVLLVNGSGTNISITGTATAAFRLDEIGGGAEI